MKYIKIDNEIYTSIYFYLCACKLGLCFIVFVYVSQQSSTLWTCPGQCQWQQRVSVAWLLWSKSFWTAVICTTTQSNCFSNCILVSESSYWSPLLDHILIQLVTANKSCLHIKWLLTTDTLNKFFCTLRLKVKRFLLDWRAYILIKCLYMHTNFNPVLAHKCSFSLPLSVSFFLPIQVFQQRHCRGTEIASMSSLKSESLSFSATLHSFGSQFNLY